LRDLIVQSWDADAAKRPEFAEILVKLKQMKHLCNKEKGENHEQPQMEDADEKKPADETGDGQTVSETKPEEEEEECRGKEDSYAQQNGEAK